MNKIALFLAVLSAPLCADQYVSVGVGPYAMIPNIGLGVVEDMEFGKLDVSLNLSLSRIVTILEAKGTIRIPCEDFYCGPSLHIVREKVDGIRSRVNFGVGLAVGKEFEDSFMQVTVQDNFSSEGMGSIPNVKIQYGVYY